MSEVFHNGIVAAIATYAAVNIGRILWPGNDSSLGLKNWFHNQNVDIKYWKNKVCFIYRCFKWNWGSIGYINRKVWWYCNCLR